LLFADAAPWLSRAIGIAKEETTSEAPSEASSFFTTSGGTRAGTLRRLLLHRRNRRERRTVFAAAVPREEADAASLVPLFDLLGDVRRAEVRRLVGERLHPRPH